MSQSTAILLLRELTDDDVLIKKGKTKNLRYYENKKSQSGSNCGKILGK